MGYLLYYILWNNGVHIDVYIWLILLSRARATIAALTSRKMKWWYWWAWTWCWRMWRGYWWCCCVIVLLLQVKVSKMYVCLSCICYIIRTSLYLKLWPIFPTSSLTYNLSVVSCTKEKLLLLTQLNELLNEWMIPP